MRIDCRHYESRTYGSGEMVRKCRLDLAPEAPWRCPDDCPLYEVRRMDVGWNYGSLGKAKATPSPEPDGTDVAALLNAAEDIVNSAAPDVLADFEAQQQKRGRFGRRNKRKKK
jgi:hypothetical protein